MDKHSPYLQEIAQKLWSGHATIMVGAGFSKNAEKTDSNLPSMLDWNQLGDVFFEKIRGDKPKPEDTKYLSLLKLAEELEATFDRHVLNQTIKVALPDKSYAPSQLHVDLLRLPWVDVFTTNYDTLLERATEQVEERRYNVVINKDDLIFSTKPRIIKLHGSFPSEYPFIITEEDYRKYPKDFAPFINTVQQALLENILCLIGFSGDDTNFLKWIGWIHDNLGKSNSPKVYLITVAPSISTGQRKLLESRNINIVDISTFCNPNEINHARSLKRFLTHLAEYNRKEEWSIETFEEFYNSKQISLKAPTLINKWQSTREKYPNWLILPHGKRAQLLKETTRHSKLIEYLHEIESPLGIQFLYEFNWRLERCLCPIDNEWIKTYETILNLYDPYNLETSDDSIDKYNPTKNKSWDWRSLKEYWRALQLSLLRYYREESQHERWLAKRTLIHTIKEDLHPEQVAQYHYECCLYAIFQFDKSKVLYELGNWPINESLPYWEAKRAGILAEIGRLIEAKAIVNESLNSVRKSLNLTLISDNLLLVSMEAYLMQMYRVFNLWEKDEITNKFSQRWTYLTQYECDPWDEIDYFNISLKNATDEVHKQQLFKHTFHLTTIRRRTIGDNDVINDAYSCLRYFEEIGIPFSTEESSFFKDTASNATKVISRYSPNWSVSTMLRLGESELIDSIFSRKELEHFSHEDVSEMIDSYIDIFNRNIQSVGENSIEKISPLESAIAVAIPNILSKLVTKCSTEQKIKILNVLIKIYQKPTLHHLGNNYQFGVSLFKSFNLTEIEKNLVVLLSIPTVNKSSLIEPFLVFNDLDLGKDKTLVKSEDVRLLILELFAKAQTSNDKQYLIAEKAIARLIWLNRVNLLDTEERDSLGNIIWSRMDKNSILPSLEYYNKWYYLQLPVPRNIKPNEKFAEYINAYDFNNLCENSADDRSIGFGGKHKVSVINNIVGAVKQDIFKLDKNTFVKIVEALIHWWNTDKRYLKFQDDAWEGTNVIGEFKLRFSSLVSFFVQVLPKNAHYVDNFHKQALQRILNEFNEYEMSSLKAKVSFLKVIPDNEDNIITELKSIIYSSNEDKVSDCINAIYIAFDENLFQKDKINLLEIISEKIKYRSEVSLINSLTVMAQIIEEFPEDISIGILENIEIGLLHLISESKVISEDDDKSVNTKIKIRIACAKLSLALHRFYTNKHEDIPQYVIRWKEQCLNRNEFIEVRILWENEIIRTPKNT